MSHRRQEKERNQKKENLINNLKNEVFCKVGVSKVSGVGVIAIRDIPKGTKIFECCNNDDSDLPTQINANELKGVDDSILEYMKNFLVPCSPNTYPLPSKGLNSINIIYYLNHSNEPNTEFHFTEDLDDFVSFVTSRGVKEGEELTQDYNNLSNDKEELLKQFPFLPNKK